MRFLSILFAAVIALILFNGCTSQAPLQQAVEGPHSLRIYLAGLKCCDSSVRIAVYRDAAAWLKKGGLVRGRIIIAQETEETVEIHGLAKGNYAVAVFQDINGNGVLDRRLGFLPKEPYGFSNNVGRYGPVSFNKAAVIVPDTTELRIELNHR